MYSLLKKCIFLYLRIYCYFTAVFFHYKTASKTNPTTFLLDKAPFFVNQSYNCIINQSLRQSYLETTTNLRHR